MIEAAEWHEEQAEINEMTEAEAEACGAPDKVQKHHRDLATFHKESAKILRALASAPQEPAPSADAEEPSEFNQIAVRYAKEIAAHRRSENDPRDRRDLISIIKDAMREAEALRRYAGDRGVTGCWLEEESRAVERHTSLCGVCLSDEEKLLFRSGWRAALRRPITDAEITAAREAYLVEQDGGFVPNMRAALEAAARAKSSEKGGAR